MSAGGFEGRALMSKPFDATMRKLIELEPAAWLRFLHVPVADPTRVRVIDSNLSTVTAEADKVLWIDDPNPSIEHIELQATRDVDLAHRAHWYSANLGYSRKVPVHTTIVVLRPAADGPELSGTLEQCDRQGDVYNWFRYNVVRIWHQPVQEVLSAGLPVLPLRLWRMSSRTKSAAYLRRFRSVLSRKPVLIRRRRSGRQRR